MEPDIFKGLIVTFIVFGCLTLGLGAFSVIRAKSRKRGLNSLLRGALAILIWGLAYYFFRRGFFEGTLGIFLILGLTMVSTLLEIVLLRRFRDAFPQQPMTEDIWQQKRKTKRQVIFFTTLMTTLGVLVPAIVFRIVAPEVIGLLWWLLLIVIFGLVGFWVAIRQWNAYETKFSSIKTPSE